MSAKNKILVIDDDSSILELIKYNLEKEGFEVEVAASGTEGIEIAKAFDPDMILLDIMMPGIDGVETCRQVREIAKLQDVFVLFLTARSEEYSEVAAFDAGANDFISKPVKPRALVSRIKAYFRREVNTARNGKSISVKGLTIDKDSYTVHIDNKKVVLAKKEFELLYFLCQHPNKIFNRDELLKKVWGADVYVVSRTVDVHIRKIREKVGSNYISTVKGIGYKLELTN